MWTYDMFACLCVLIMVIGPRLESNYHFKICWFKNHPFLISWGLSSSKRKQHVCSWLEHVGGEPQKALVMNYEDFWYQVAMC